MNQRLGLPGTVYPPHTRNPNSVRKAHLQLHITLMGNEVEFEIRVAVRD